MLFPRIAAPFALKTVAWGLGFQFAFAVLVLRVDTGRRVFQKAGDVVSRLLSYSFVGSQFVFGDLGKQGFHLGFYFAFQVLPGHHFHLRVFRGALSLRDHADRHSALPPGS